jgi:hypothetical protein
MAFSGENLVRSSAQANGNATFNYSSADDALAAIIAADYFSEASATSGGYGLKNGDYIFARGTDGVNILSIAVDASGAATVESKVEFA